MDIKAPVGSSLVFDFKLSALFMFGWLLFITVSFVVLAAIGHFFLLKDEDKPDTVRGSISVCRGLRISVNLSKECAEYAKKNFPAMECVTSITYQKPDGWDDCAVCNITCSRSVALPR